MKLLIVFVSLFLLQQNIVTYQSDRSILIDTGKYETYDVDHQTTQFTINKDWSKIVHRSDSGQVDYFINEVKQIDGGTYLLVNDVTGLRVEIFLLDDRLAMFYTYKGYSFMTVYFILRRW